MKVACMSISKVECVAVLPCNARSVLLQGALIATAWTALMHLGEQGYLDHTARIMQVRLQCLLIVG